ncbi:hypothetical protein A9Q83_14185 [Alphaproteobacteria bacterium 46_93_T64]|nr:hypothetical protein A9Q83_14185 [Alphaproteobacteria bacterium 46_93_T64]
MQKISPIKKWLGAGSKILLDTIFPALCPRCNEAVDEPGSLCADCWGQANFISPPTCFHCGYPFEYEVADDMLCGNCISNPPPFTRGLSVLHYDDVSRDMILAFKHADRTDRVPAFANWMSRTAAEILKDDVLIAPVPLHRKRLLKRRYNQSALLAQSIGNKTNRRVAVDLLLRSKDTSSQGGKNLKARFKNIRGAFSVNPVWQDTIKGEHILLIDDVYTTGATVSACASCLLRAGVRQIDILTLCRVVRPVSMSI